MSLESLLATEPAATLKRQTSQGASDDTGLPLHGLTNVRSVQGRAIKLGASQIDAWAALAETYPDHRGHDAQNVRRSRTEKRTMWRVDLRDSGTVEVAATPKDAARVVLTINHRGLPDVAEIEPWRTYWKRLIEDLTTSMAAAQ